MNKITSNNIKDVKKYVTTNITKRYAHTTAFSIFKNNHRVLQFQSIKRL